MAGISFDPEDRATRAFLEGIGVSESVIDRGKISLIEASGSRLNFSVLETLAYDDSTGAQLSSAEAKKALELLKRDGENTRALFRDGQCPGWGVSANTILINRLGLNVGTRIFGRIEPESLCPYDPKNYTVEDQIDIHFEETMVPQALRDTGKSVVLIAFNENGKKGAGSGVAVSRGGDILTAAHVIYANNGKGKFRDRVLMKIEGKVYEISEKDVVKRETGSDAVLVHVSGVTINSPIPIANAPPMPGDVVWFIGFPSQDAGETSDHKTFTIGKVKEATVTPADGRATIITSAKVTHGYSGGAIVNDRGELVGITSFIMTKKGVAAVIMSEAERSIGNMPPHTYKGTPDDIRHGLDKFPPKKK